MLKNYYEIDENSSITSFLKEVNEKKNTQYIILNTSPMSFVDIRTIALKVHYLDEKLKSLKKPLAINKDSSENLNFLIDSGDRVIKTENSYYDFLDALNEIKENNYDFLKKLLSTSTRKEIFALNEKDKISTARNILIKNRINLLPVIDNLKLVGEIRTMDLLVNNLVDSSKNKKDYYNSKIAENSSNLPISNLLNKKPLIIDVSKTYADALDIMINKKISSLIVVENQTLYSIISYKDIFKLLKADLDSNKFLIEYTGVSNIYDDEYDLIQDYAEKSMNKISKFSNYDSLKVNLKVLGNKEGTHKKKILIKLLLSFGNHILHIEKEMVQGTSDEENNNKVRGKWNVPLLMMEALSALEKKVIDERRKNNNNNNNKVF